MMSGWAPTVAVVSGRAFAGNATIAGHSDLIIATRGSAVGMGGPPLVEQALGIKMTPEELGAVEMHEKSGGIDLLVADEPAAIAALQYLRFSRMGEQRRGAADRRLDRLDRPEN
jgi:acetyl-CoA carboxylase carboxyltransferase component